MKISEIKSFLETVESMEDFLALSLHEDARIGVQKLLKQKHNVLLKKEAMKQKFYDMNVYERGVNSTLVAGIDEVGRGPLAGEVVAAAVILNQEIIGLDDSKKLNKKVRNELYKKIISTCDYGIGVASVEEIDEYNIYEATKMAMRRAVENLKVTPEHLLVDAMTLDIGIPETKIIKGDSISNSIAAASILAKEHRDLLMRDYGVIYPVYGFHKNSGYGTKEHLDGLESYGVCPIHRKTFQPIKDILNTLD